jgi:hypothetical protein
MLAVAALCLRLFCSFCFVLQTRTARLRSDGRLSRRASSTKASVSNATQRSSTQTKEESIRSPLSSLLRGNSLREILLGGDSFVVVVVLTCLRDGVMSSGIFGSDFSMIGKVLFHGNRDRRQVKNKFKRCETFQNPRQALRF